MSGRTDRRRRGFALPMALLALALITSAVVAAFAATSAETVANNAMRAQDRAYQIAEAGLQQFILRRTETGFCSNCVTNPAQADSEWTRVSVPGGYANVVATRLRRSKLDGTPALFFLRSTGVDTTVRMSGGGNAVYARRTLGLYGTWGTAPMRVYGSIVTLNGVTNTSSAPGINVAINGADACNVLAAVAGLVVPDLGGYSGNGESPIGNPNVDSTMLLDSLRRLVGIDWEGILERDAIPADFTIPQNAWPTVLQMLTSPVIRATGDLTLPGSGRGLLIVEGNLTISGSRTWDGVILVGGTITASGTGEIEGAVVTGLNRMLGAPDPGRDLLNNRNTFRFNSCEVTAAANKVDRYFALSNTWMDNIAIW